MKQRIITFSRNVFIPLTTVCHNRCGYCCFRTPVQDGCILLPHDVERTLKTGAAMGCTEALFTFGERPGLEAGFNEYIKKTGYHDILDYCHALCEKSIGHGILPHTNAGVLTFEELQYLSEVNASMGLMLETTAEIPAHKNSPGKDPAVRIETIENAGKLKIPFTTGILLGIGETESDREESLMVIRDLHRRYGHIQEVIIQNFCPKENTLMAGYPVVSPDEICLSIMMAKQILPDDIAVQIPPNLADAGRLIRCGVDDLGGVSPLTIDYVNPEHPWPQIDELRALVENAELKERLCIYPQYIRRQWYPERLEPLITQLHQNLMDKERW